MNKTGLILLLLIFYFFAGARQQEPVVGSLTYISPVPGSRYIMPGNNIALRHGEPFDPASLHPALLEVRGLKGELISGKAVLSDDERTFIFLPERPFGLGEEITIKLNPGLKTVSGIAIAPLSFNFYVTGEVIPVDEAFVDKFILEKGPGLIRPENLQLPASGKGMKNDLPPGYPANTVLVDNDPPDGYYFFAPHDDWGWFPGSEPFLTITDKHGTPVYYRKLENSGFELKLLPNGYLSFYSFHPFWYHMIMDSSFRIIDYYKIENGYPYTDFHDFLLLENGHSFVMTFDPQLVDMSQVVPGGHPEAVVTGFVMQELDVSRNVVFQWRSWDHYEITETGPEIDLTAENIDYVHGNSIEVESDTSLLISSRNMHEVTRIHRNTGEIIWRLGGSQNQFEFFGDDTLRFNRQHDSRRLASGNITVFDNGTKRPEPQFSSVPEFEIDEENFTATLVSRFRSDPDYFGQVMGNAFLTPEATTVIGWGSGIPGITEINQQGDVLYELHFEGLNYRAYRFPWETNYFKTNTDTLDFGFTWSQSQKTDSIEIRNMQEEEILITGHHLHSDIFSVENEYPVVIPAGDTAFLLVTFNPEEEGVYGDLLTIHSDTNSDTLVQRIARQVKLTGHAAEGQGTGSFQSLQVTASPNPVSGMLMLSFGERMEAATVSVVNARGQTVMERSFGESASYTLDMHSLPEGLYLIEIRSGKAGKQGAVKIVKSRD